MVIICFLCSIFYKLKLPYEEGELGNQVNKAILTHIWKICDYLIYICKDDLSSLGFDIIL